MDTFLPQAYLIGLVAILLIAAVVLGRQIWRVRKDEVTLARLERSGEGAPDDAASLYELASVQLRKRLYGQAVDNLRRALRKAESDKEPAEALALIQNAHYGRAVLHYATLLKEDPQAYTGLYHWEIHVASAAGDLWLPVGYAQSQPIPVRTHLARYPASAPPGSAPPVPSPPPGP